MSMNKKYEFVEGDEVTTPSGVTLKRIRALIAIADAALKDSTLTQDLALAFAKVVVNKPKGSVQ